MAFLSGLLGYENGQGKGQHDAYLNALARDDDQKALIAEQKRWDAEQATRQQQADAVTAKNTADTAQFSRDREFEQGLRMPWNWSKMPDADKASYLQKRQTAALQAGDTDVAKSSQDAINGIALGTQREASAAFTGGARTRNVDSATAVNQHRLGLIDAQAAAARDLPARVREVAAGHDAASLQRAELQISSRKELAIYSAGVRAQLIPLAAAYRLQGIDETNSTRLAIADFNGRVQVYRSQTDPRRELLSDGTQPPAVDPTTAGIPTPAYPNVQMPSVNITLPSWPTANNSGPGSGGSAPRTWSPPRSAGNPRNVDAAGRATAGTQRTDTQSEPPGLTTAGQQELRAAKKAISDGAPVAAVVAHLRQASGLSPHELQAIERALRGAGTEPAKPAASQRTPFSRPPSAGGPVSNAVFGEPPGGAGGAPSLSPF